MDHRLMLGWARRNLNALRESEAAFHRKRPYHLWGDLDPETGEHRIRVAVAETIRPPDEWTFQIGDVLHNLRVALDYLAFAVAVHQRPTVALDEEQARRIQFPVCEHGRDWPSFVGRVSQWASPQTVATLEHFQPFRSELANIHPLLLLHRLDNPHKHQHLIAAAPNVSAIHRGPRGYFEDTRNGLEGPFEDGTVIARGRFRRPAKTPSNLRAVTRTDAAFDVVFDEAGPAPLYPAFTLLEEIADYLERAVFPLIESEL